MKKLFLIIYAGLLFSNVLSTNDDENNINIDHDYIKNIVQEQIQRELVRLREEVDRITQDVAQVRLDQEQRLQQLSALKQCINLTKKIRLNFKNI
ncbi:MAG TPA: hypothetical protein VL201_02500 [Patescibacteria group bacterium]|nr:hypothetical protein [Patescibacteria group bacterium]